MQSKLYNNVKHGKNCFFDYYTLIGYPPLQKGDGELETVIGDNAYIRSYTVVYAGNVIGDSFTTGHHVMIRELNNIGDNVSIGTNSVVEHHIEIHNGVRVHSNVFIPEFSVLEEESWLDPNVVITNAVYPRSLNVKESLKGVVIKRKAKIGANATILPGITIGENALVGAGAVVTKDVPPGKVLIGNPAKVINDISNLPYR
jgi:acetyltransferase-like isoleucine patch superfamily enzyme